MNARQRSALGMLAMIGAAAAVGLYVWFGVLRADEAEKARKETSDRLLPITEVDALSVTARGGHSRLEKHEGKWRMIAPVPSAVDEAVVSELLRTLTTGKVKATIEDAPSEADLRRYGLQPPAFLVAATSGNQEVAVEGGIENPFDGSVYLRRRGEAKVHAVEGQVRQALEKSAFDLRAKELVTLPDAEVARIELRQGKTFTALTRAANGTWRIEKPRPEEADRTEVESLLGSLRADRALAFPEVSQASLEALRLDAPVAEVTIAPTQGDPLRLRYGEVDDGSGVKKTHVLRERGAETLIAEVGRTGLTAVQRPPEAWRDRSVLRFDKAAVRELRFWPRGGAERIVARKVSPEGAPEEWLIGEGDAAKPARKYALSGLVWALGSVKAEAEAGKPAAKHGLSPEGRRVEVVGQGGQVLATLLLGNDVPGKPGAVYARGTTGQVVELERSRLSELPQTAADLIEPGETADAGVAFRP